MSDTYRRCSECDYYTRGTVRAADRGLADHQRSTGHMGEGRTLGIPPMPRPTTDAPMFCRIYSDDYPCRAGLMVDLHGLDPVTRKWVHPELDDKGRYVWPEGTLL